LLWYSSLLRTIYALMAMSVALGVVIGIGLLITARLLRARVADHEREYSNPVSSPMPGVSVNTTMALTPTFHTPPTTPQTSPQVRPDFYALSRTNSWRNGLQESEAVPVPFLLPPSASDAEPSDVSSGAPGSHLPPERLENGWMRVGHLEISPFVLGRGAFGTVVSEGRMMPGGRLVAIKQLSRKFYDNAREEISILIDLDEHSQHVVRHFGTEEDEDNIYLALELCAGSMFDRVAAGDIPAPPRTYTRGPPPHFTWRALRQLMQGLADIHNREIVHYDLRPHNVLVTRERFDVKLADVGLARRLEPDWTGSNAVANPTSGAGTLGWRAPEVLRGSRQAKAVDIFSAGCIVAFVLTKGVHPFGSIVSERDGNIMHARADLEALEALDLPEAVDIVRRMISYTPSERPSAAEVLMHPFFWSDTTKLAFLCDIWNRLSELRNRAATYTEFIMSLDSSELAMRCEGWPSRMPPEIMTEMARSHEGSWSVSSLLRYIRNKRAHYSQLTPALQRLLGPLPDENSQSESGSAYARTPGNSPLMTPLRTPMDPGHVWGPPGQGAEADNFFVFFQRRVPHLLMCVYSHACSHPALVRSDHFRQKYGFWNLEVPETPPIGFESRIIHIPDLQLAQESVPSDAGDQGGRA
jgi:serine/threonine-protein kinase/endoribonuclease IRE1